MKRFKIIEETAGQKSGSFCIETTIECFTGYKLNYSQFKNHIMKKFSLISEVEKGLRIEDYNKQESFFNLLHRVINCSGIAALSESITDKTEDLQDFFRLKYHNGRYSVINCIIDINHDMGLINYFES